MSDDVIERAHQLLQPKVQYVQQLKRSLDAETRLKQRVKDLQSDRSYAVDDEVQSALDAALSSTQQALDAAKEATKTARKSALNEGGWSRRDLTELGLISTRNTRQRRGNANSTAQPAESQPAGTSEGTQQPQRPAGADSVNAEEAGDPRDLAG